MSSFISDLIFPKIPRHVYETRLEKTPEFSPGDGWERRDALDW